MKRCFNFTMAAVLAAAMLATGCGGNGSGTTDVTASGQEQQGTQGTAQAEGQQETGQVTGQQGTVRDDVIVVMGPTSEPEAGFDPAYGWGAGRGRPVRSP